MATVAEATRPTPRGSATWPHRINDRHSARGQGDDAGLDDYTVRGDCFGRSPVPSVPSRN